MGFFDEDDVCTMFTTDCGQCGLYGNCRSPKMITYGTGKNGIMLLINKPSEYQDSKGCLECDDEFTVLSDKFSDLGIDLRDSTVITALGCKCDKPTALHYNYCRARLNDCIEERKPKLIIALGSSVLYSTVGVDFTRNIGSVDKWRGFIIPVSRWNCWVVHTYSMFDLILDWSIYGKNEKWSKAKSISAKEDALKNNNAYKIRNRLFNEDIYNAMRKRNDELPVDPSKISIAKVILSDDEAVSWIEKAIVYFTNNPDGYLSSDIETSSLKCYNNNQFVYSIGLMYDEAEGAVAFKTTSKKVIDSLVRLFSLNPKIIGANWKFDRNWIFSKFGVQADNLYWDTVLMAHILDNRDEITSLKFCTYRYFGVSYEDTVHKYLIAQGSNELNTIKEAPIEDLLYYNALDVVYTWYVRKEQEKEFELFSNPNKQFAKDLFHKGSIALAKMEYNGMPIDLSIAQKSRDYCVDHLKAIDEAIKEEPTWREWCNIYGDKASLVSEAQIIDIFIKRKGMWAEGVSRRKKAKADRDFVSRMVKQEPFLNYVLEKRKWEKMNATYLESYFKEANDDGRIRCFYGLNNVSSYRMSSNTPNLQNQSSRDPEQVSLLKSCFTVPEGTVLFASDFSALENYISASITDDPYMLGCLGQIDMHKDNALSSFICTEEQFTELKQYDEDNGTKLAKTLRNLGKSFSFSCLYGATEETVAEALWVGAKDHNAMITPTLSAIEHLIIKLNMEDEYTKYLKKTKSDILDKDEFYFECFKSHIKTCLDRFWNERMKVTGEWRNKTFEDFVKYGYVDYPVGLQIKGFNTRNSILNSPVQGSGSCVTLWCLTRLQYLLEQNNMKAKLVGVIHDSILAIVPKEEVVQFGRMIKTVMEDETRKVFTWLKINLKIESEYSDTSWCKAKDYDEEEWLKEV